jgi:membrane-bound lytic murein transglycosylase D
VLINRNINRFLKPAILVILLLPALAAAKDMFDKPAVLEPDVAFWRRVFAETSSNQALLHDSRYLEIVYEVVEIPEDATPSRRRRIADLARNRYREMLLKLAKSDRSGLNGEERRVLALWPEDISDAELIEASKRIRFQQGLSDRFLAGLKRSGAWKPHIKQQLTANKVPLGLSALPHVESSFNPEARSHVGAAGLWQFTRSTGQRFMEIDHVIDERRDPFRSSEAAAQLLAYNYSILKSWPLAITAYNHGVAGMRRAVSQMGTEDIGVINRKYKGRTFGFASRNFYVAFLAALEVEQNAAKYFGEVEIDKPRADLVIESPSYIPASNFAAALNVSEATLRAFNPALLAPIWDGTKHIPRGYGVRVPAKLVDMTEQEVLAAIPSTQRFARQTPDMYHKVRRGESLSVIAARYDTSVRELVSLNGLKSKHRIRVGQTLRLPFAGQGIPDGAETYTVRNGDSLSLIASRAGITQASLMDMNGLRDKNKIYVGQTLYLQPRSANSVQSAAPATPATTVAQAQPVKAAASLDDAGSKPASPVPPEAAAPVAAPVASEPGSELVAADIAQPSAKTLIAAETAEPVAEDLIAAETAELDDDDLIVAETAELDAEDAEDASAVTESQAAVAANASLADPNDYTVGDDGTIEIQAAETLGHYADWLGVKTQKIRNINGLEYGKPVVVGRRIKLDFSAVAEDEFVARRVAHHRAMQEAFYVRYRVMDTTEHRLREGESVWLLAQQRYKVPVWLLRQYNPDLDFGRVRPGMRIVVPRIEPIEREAGIRQSVAEAG